MTKKETLGATTQEKWDICWLLACVALGSGILAVGLMGIGTNPILWLLAVPAGSLIACGGLAIYPRVEMIALRIRIEESQRHSEVIDEIVAIYKGEK